MQKQIEELQNQVKDKNNEKDVKKNRIWARQEYLRAR